MKDLQLEDQIQRKHGGILGWWLRLTAPPGAQDYDTASTYKMREQLRRAGLTSIVALFVFVAPLLLLQQAADLGTSTAILALMCVALLALVLNRFGRQTLAALFLVLSMDVIIEGSLIFAKGGLGAGWLLTFSLLTIPLMTAGILLPRVFLWSFLLLHVLCILGDFYWLPHASDLDTLVNLWHGPLVALARPIIELVGIGLLTYLVVRSMEQAIARANRAEEVTALQQKIAEQKQQLEQGIEEMSKTLTHAANGYFTVRVTLPQENLLWKLSQQLNTLLLRLQSAKQTEQTLRQVEIEAERLVNALAAVKAGQAPIWPQPNGGPLDTLLKEIRSVPSSPDTQNATRTAKFGPRIPPQIPPMH